MGVRQMCAIGCLLVSAAGTGRVPAQTRSRTLRAVNVRPAVASIKNAIVTPQSLDFVTADPDLGGVPANSPAMVSWEITGAQPTGTWMLSVRAGGSAFSGCGTVPVSAVTVRCASATSGRQAGPATCGAPFQLSNQPQAVASGSHENVNSRFTVTIDFSFLDRWQYIGTSSPCTLNLSYIIDAS